MKHALFALAMTCLASFAPVVVGADTLDPSTFKQTMRRPLMIVDTAPVNGVQMRWANGAYDYGYGAWVECATFVNNGPKTATAVRIAFNYLDRNKTVVARTYSSAKARSAPARRSKAAAA